MPDSPDILEEEQAILAKEDEIVTKIKKRLEDGGILYSRTVLESLDAQISDPNWTSVTIKSWLEPGKQMVVERKQGHVLFLLSSLSGSIL
jgi:hypothetical protein